MIGLLVVALAGVLMGCYFRVGFVILACLVFLIADILRILLKSEFQFADILILFAYMSALQGGFMLGAYLKHRRRS
ncbi:MULTISPECIES: hypothetical protein [unclassified Methylobacterium]|jgi:hypothetical protein|uniref:hypothetical protein n=1 Tax=unclassified Methylobacterium TaxID=2615210 RepID=UPI001354E46C|nr:hypothetical protein [Methylobacterium sp. 2A]MWV20787.1 hypothetical protein [Methylobacterium sp. 2A]